MTISRVNVTMQKIDDLMITYDNLYTNHIHTNDPQKVQTAIENMMTLQDKIKNTASTVLAEIANDEKLNQEEDFTLYVEKIEGNADALLNNMIMHSTSLLSSPEHTSSNPSQVTPQIIENQQSVSSEQHIQPYSIIQQPTYVQTQPFYVDQTQYYNYTQPQQYYNYTQTLPQQYYNYTQPQQYQQPAMTQPQINPQPEAETVEQMPDQELMQKAKNSIQHFQKQIKALYKSHIYEQDREKIADAIKAIMKIQKHVHVVADAAIYNTDHAEMENLQRRIDEVNLGIVEMLNELIQHSKSLDTTGSGSPKTTLSNPFTKSTAAASNPFFTNSTAIQTLNPFKGASNEKPAANPFKNKVITNNTTSTISTTNPFGNKPTAAPFTANPFGNKPAVANPFATQPANTTSTTSTTTTISTSNPFGNKPANPFFGKK